MSPKLLKAEFYQIDPKKICPLCKKQREYFCELGCNTCKANVAKVEAIVKARK